MKIAILNSEGKDTGRSVELPADIFGVEPNEHAVYLAVKQFLANQRQGTHKTKERGEIKGSTKKIKKQKGTGTARAGSIKSPVFRGGGRIFGPKPRNYSIKLNKKVKSLAKASALSHKAAEGKVKVIEDFTFDAPRTKSFINVLDGMELSNQKSLFVTNDYDNNLYLSSRNLPNARVMNAKDISTYDILHSNTLVISEGSIEKIKELFA